MIPLQRIPVVTAVAVLTASSAFTAVAQEASDWRTRAEFGASVFFGNTSQTVVTTTASAERTSAALGLASRMTFTYGEATDADGNTRVNNRAWNIGTDLNFNTSTPLNAFMRGKVESTFEKKIDLRWSIGGGGRIQFLRGSTSRAELSVAVVAERTIPRKETDQPTLTVAKWAGRFLFTREMAEGRVTFESDTSYEPEVKRFGTFTLNSRNALAFRLKSGLALQVSVRDAYDSSARSRGARTNNDGQLFFSVVSTF